ncbi:MAG TPA: SEC-C domain-containing protein [Herpetosiphonaceae bacterium]
MPNIGRNDPCPCGSGKKYKQCHGPIDAERAAAQRKIKQAPDTLWPKIMDSDSFSHFVMAAPTAFSEFWNGAYSAGDMKDLDQHEDRGSERFLTWSAFDIRNEEGQTLVQQLIADPADLELTDAEKQVLAGWGNVRLQPYEIVDVRKGQGIRLRPLFGEGELYVEDQAAAKRLQAGEVLIAHLAPAADVYFIQGAAAHLTSDTVEKLREFAEIHLQDLQQSQPDATYEDLIQSRSQIFNHFVMALPREEQDSNKVNELVAQTRATLNVTAAQMGFGGGQSQPSAKDRLGQMSEQDDEPGAVEESVAEEAALDVDSDANAVYGVGDTTQTLESGGAPTTTSESPDAGMTQQGTYEGQDD